MVEVEHIGDVCGVGRFGQLLRRSPNQRATSPTRELLSFATSRPVPARIPTGALAVMSLLRQFSRTRTYVCQQCIRRQQTTVEAQRRKTTWAKKTLDPERAAAKWEQRAEKIKNGHEKSMLTILEERGFVKDVAGYASCLSPLDHI